MPSFRKHISTIFYLLSLAVVMSLPVSAAGRHVISLNDGWNFTFGADTAAIGVHLPHSWNSDAYETRDYRRGKVVYTRMLSLPQSIAGKRVYLKLDGAANKCDVAVDGSPVGSRVGAYSSHIFDLTPYLMPGQQHNLEVTVDNGDRSIPPYSADFTFMGGLYRDAWLIATDNCHFDLTSGPDSGIKVTSRINNSDEGLVEVAGQLINAASGKSRLTLTCTVSDPDGRQVAAGTARYTVSDTAGFKLSLPAISGIRKWSPESPALYSVTATVTDGNAVVDSATVYTGFRTFGFDEAGRFLLNGALCKLRGMCRHQDQAPMGIALTDDMHRRDMRLIKDMGANFIRISHYPQDDAVLEMCDRLGLIAWEEIPVIDYVPDDEAFADNCETMLRDMIARHYNHPSIVMWGYMNEILLRVPAEGRDATWKRTLQLARRLQDVLEECDTTRLSTMAFHGNDVYHKAGLSDITGVKGWNLYQGWYGGSFPEFEEKLSREHREHPDHRLIVSEYGAGSDLRLHSLKPEAFDFSMEYQQQYLEHYLPVIEDSVFVAGASHWNFIDFSSANRAESMPHINNKGLVTNDRRKKDVYYYYQAAWNDADSLTVAHIAVRDWPVRTEITDASRCITRPVKVYTNLPEIELEVNGKRMPATAVVNYNAVTDVELRAGDNFLAVYSSARPDSVLDMFIVHLDAIPMQSGSIDTGLRELAVNVGSDCYYTSPASSLTWLPDRQYTPGSGYGHIGGRRVVTQDEIALTDDQPLLQHSLAGIEGYRLDLMPGTYEVELMWADPAKPSEASAYMLGHNSGNADGGVISMDIKINGCQIEEKFAPVAVAGSKAMVCHRYIANVGSDHRLNIDFSPAGGNTSLAALKVHKL